MSKITNAVALIICLFVAACAPTGPDVDDKAISQRPVARTEPLAIPVQPIESLPQLEGDKAEARASELISDVTISASSFNPQKGEGVTVGFKLSKRAKVEVKIYDPDFALVTSLKPKRYMKAGQSSLTWDGKDMNGIIVPDEAYFFTITAEDQQGTVETYDPTIFSGGEAEDITEADVDPTSKVITYRLPKPARVLIRLGVQDGPLLNTLVDWKPRVSGEITEPWNGRDKDNLIDLLNHPRFKMLITYFALPENSMITYGNKAVSYRAYKQSLKQKGPAKNRPDRAGVLLSPHYSLPRTADYSPRLKMDFSDIQTYEQGDVPVLRAKTLIKVDIDELDKSFFVNQQYEITFFLDNEFYAEQEVGYAPFNWVWDLSDVNEGEHLVTVNMSGFKDQIGVLSKRVIVVK
jgi:hypothetical protein